MNESTLAAIRTDFSDYACDLVEKLLKLTKNSFISEEDKYSLLLGLHNLKGAASSLGFDAFSRHCHNIENYLTADITYSDHFVKEIRTGLEALPGVAEKELEDLLADGKSNVPMPKPQEVCQLATLLYISKRNEAMDNSVEDILKVARKNNKVNDITGALLFSGYYFVQVLEGDRRKLNRLYQKIEKDRRHEEVQLCYLADIGERFFRRWRMAYFPDSQSNRERLRCATDADEFLPENYSSKLLLHMMRKLAKELELLNF